MFRSDPTSSYTAASVDHAQVGLSNLATPLHFAKVNPGVILELIAQAETKITTFELWRERIYSDACVLLTRIKQERLDYAAQIRNLDHEVRTLQEKSTEAERVAYMALIELEDALRLCEMANARIIEAEEKADAAERRAEIAEEWLEKIQAAMTSECSDEPRAHHRSEESSSWRFATEADAGSREEKKSRNKMVHFW